MYLSLLGQVVFGDTTFLTENRLVFSTDDSVELQFDGTDTIETISNVTLSSTGKADFSNYDATNFTTTTLYVNEYIEYTCRYGNLYRGGDLRLGEGAFYTTFSGTTMASPNTMINNSTTTKIVIPRDGLYHVYFTYIIDTTNSTVSHDLVNVIIGDPNTNKEFYRFGTDLGRNRNAGLVQFTDTISFIQNLTQNTQLSVKFIGLDNYHTVRVFSAAIGAYYLGTSDK